MTGNVDNIQYTLTNVKLPEYIDDKTQPMSTLTADVDITEPMEYFYVDPLEDAWVISGTPNRIMWRFIFSNGIEMTNDNADYETNGTLYIRGTKGSALSLQLISEAPSDMSNIAIPTGTFPMNTEYIDLYTDYSSSLIAQTTLSGNPDMSDPFGLGVGTFYYVIDQIESNGQQITSVVDGGGAVINKGQTTITETGDGTYEVAIEFYDKFGHKISSTQSFSMSAAATTQSVIRGTLQHNGYMYNPVFAAFSNSQFASVPAVATLK